MSNLFTWLVFCSSQGFFLLLDICVISFHYCSCYFFITTSVTLAIILSAIKTLVMLTIIICTIIFILIFVVPVLFVVFFLYALICYYLFLFVLMISIKIIIGIISFIIFLFLLLICKFELLMHPLEPTTPFPTSNGSG